MVLESVRLLVRCGFAIHVWVVDSVLDLEFLQIWCTMIFGFLCRCFVGEGRWLVLGASVLDCVSVFVFWVRAPPNWCWVLVTPKSWSEGGAIAAKGDGCCLFGLLVLLFELLVVHCRRRYIFCFLFVWFVIKDWVRLKTFGLCCGLVSTTRKGLVMLTRKGMVTN